MELVQLQTRKYQHAAILFVAAILFCNFGILEAKTLPPWLPWFTYTDSVSNLDQYLKDKVPIGHRNVFLLARHVSVTRDVNLTSSYYAQDLPFELTVVCETLEVTNMYDIDLSGANAPGYVSAAAMNPPRLIVAPINAPQTSWPSNVAWDGKTGGDGGSIFIYAKNKTGNGKLNLNVSGGKGGRGQDGRRGNSGTAQTLLSPVVHGENGGAGGRGGRGGNAGEIFVNSCNNPSTIIERTTMNGGAGGSGGTGGRGGRGAAGSWRFLTSARHGNNGANGREGLPGQMTMAEKNHESSIEGFYRSVPITGNYLQRTLNVEMYKIMLARTQNSSDRWLKIRDAVTWIRDIASTNGYDIVYKRCSYMLELCNQLQHDTPSPSTTRIRKSAIKEHLDDIKRVAELAVTIEPSNINKKIQSSLILTQHSHYARAFHHLARQYNKSKDRYNDVKEDAGSLNVSINIKSAVTTFLDITGSSLSSKLSEKITSIARSKTFVTSALDTVETGGEVAIDSAEILGELALGAEAAPVLGLVVAERVVQSAVERVAVDIIGGSIISELNKVWGTLFDDVEEALSNSERIIQARAMNQKSSGMNRNSRVRKDEKLRKTSHPTKRQRYLRPGQRDRLRLRLRQPESNPQPFELIGKYIGVLDKLEPIETNINQVVVTFDAIYVQFTVPKGQTAVSLNSLDLKQQEELYATLESYREPFNELPSFFITTTVSSQVFNANSLGTWFEFDCEYGAGTGGAVIISSIIAFNDHLIPSFMASLDTDDDIPVTVTSIVPLSKILEAKIAYQLGLLVIQQRVIIAKRKRQVSGSSHSSCGAQAPDYTITKVKVANVGQGSCNLLYTRGHGNRPAAVYDLGYGKGKLTGTAEDSLTNAIAQSYSIVISHWDLDHYRYLLRDPQKILATSKHVTAPKFGSNTGVSVKKTVSSIGGCRLIDANTGPIHFYGAVVFNIDMRTTTLANGRSKNDVGAITVCIRDYNCNPLLLMPADASYTYVSNQQTSANSPSLKYLVATHHGSTRNIGTIPRPLNNHYLSAVMYSYGQGNRYGHNSATAQPFYQRRGWNAAPQVTVGTTNGLYVNLDLDRSHLTPPHRD